MSAFGDFADNVLDIFFGKAREAKVMARVAEEKRRRLAEMAKDPIRRKYVERIERGEYWSDEEIAFNDDVNATGVCEHLYPIEQRMRAEGIDLRPRRWRPIARLTPLCVIDPDRRLEATRKPEA